MPNYVAHELFGARVKNELAPQLRVAADAEPIAFRCGLYGPDPLLFFPGGLSLSRMLHGTWREHAAPRMQTLLESGSQGQQSFAAGYLCHLLLDDACHSHIYALMREQGLSHRLLEIGLDWAILKELGHWRFPSPALQEKKRMVHLATEIIAPVKPSEYRAGLSGMGLICRQMNGVGKLYRRKITGDYRQPVQALQEILENTVSRAVHLIEEMSAGTLLPGALLLGA